MVSSKKTLIFLHGFRGAPFGLKKIADSFADDFDVRIPSVPPFADSLPLVEYTPESYANFIADYIKSNDLVRPILIGHSMGSIIAAAVAEKYPDLIADKLIFLSPIPQKTNKLITNVQPLITVLPNKTIGKISTVFLYVPQHSKQLYRETLDAVISCGEKYTTKSDVLAAANFASTHSIADFNFKKQTLIIAGEKDRLVNKRATIAVSKNHNFNLHFIKNSGHLINYEHPAEVSKLIREFLAQ